MSKDLQRLEFEVEADLSALSAELTVAPSEGAVQRVKGAARHALNEAWLAGHRTPTPPPVVLEQVRAAVHSELEHAGEPEVAELSVAGKPVRRFPWWAIGAPLAAAAMIGICIGLAHRAGPVKPALSPGDAGAEAKLDLFVEAAEQLFADDPFANRIVGIVADLDALEESISQWEPVSEYDPGLLNNVVDEIDELLEEPDSDRGMSNRAHQARGAFG